jgi:hypothetical protein
VGAKRTVTKTVPCPKKEPIGAFQNGVAKWNSGQHLEQLRQPSTGHDLTGRFPAAGSPARLLDEANLGWINAADPRLVKFPQMASFATKISACSATEPPESPYEGTRTRFDVPTAPLEMVKMPRARANPSKTRQCRDSERGLKRHIPDERN